MNTSQKERRATTLDTVAIIVALAAGPKTLSEVQSQIVADTVGHYVRISSVYAALRRLVETGLLEEKFKTYSLTGKGWHKLDVEGRLLQQLVEHTKRRIIASGHGNW